MKGSRDRRGYSNGAGERGRWLELGGDVMEKSGWIWAHVSGRGHKTFWWILTYMHMCMPSFLHLEHIYFVIRNI